MHHRVRARRDKREIGSDLVQYLGMAMTVPFCFLNMLFGDHGPARAMKSGAVDQAGLEGLQLLPGNNMIVNVNNHDAILSLQTG
jgi:hypothetical protein